MIISPCLILRRVVIIAILANLVLGPTRFLQGFRGYGLKSKIRAFVLGRTGNLQRKKLRSDKSQ